LIVSFSIKLIEKFNSSFAETAPAFHRFGCFIPNIFQQNRGQMLKGLNFLFKFGRNDLFADLKNPHSEGVQDRPDMSIP